VGFDVVILPRENKISVPVFPHEACAWSRHAVRCDGRCGHWLPAMDSNHGSRPDRSRGFDYGRLDGTAGLLADATTTPAQMTMSSSPGNGGLVSRGFDPASYPTEPLGSYHVLPTTTWMDPPSIGDLRHWGALLTIRWGRSSGSPSESVGPPAG
jgi:hypothetical protein